MKITLESTELIVSINGIDCRVWEGHTERGVAMHAYIPRVAVRDDLDYSQFEAELKEKPAPSSLRNAIPLRMTI